MNMLENDLELLEEYLDGALDGDGLAKLRDRLAIDRQLSAALAELQSQRALRQAAYQTMDPGEIASQQLIWRVRGAMLDQQRKTVIHPNRGWSFWRLANIGSAAAACIMIGFLFGRLGHGGAVTPGISPSTPAGMVSSGPHGPNASPGFVAVRTSPRISVPITDEYGRVVAWQTFDNADQAKSFTEDMNQTHGSPSPAAGSVQPKLVDSPQPF